MKTKREIRNWWDDEDYKEFSIRTNVSEELLYLKDEFFIFLQIVHDNYFWKNNLFYCDYKISNSKKTVQLKTSKLLRFKPVEYEKMFEDIKEKTKKNNQAIVNNILSYGAMLEMYLPKNAKDRFEILKEFTTDNILLKEYEKEIEEEKLKDMEIKAKFLELCNKKVC